MNPIAENVRIRQIASALHKKHFGMLLLMSLMAAGLCLLLLVTGLVILFITTGGPWSSTARYADAAGNNLPYCLGLWGVLLVVALAGSGLLQGLFSAMLRLCRGDDAVPVGHVFSRMRYSLKAFGVNLWCTAAVLLWSLPGFLTMMGGSMFWAVGIDSITGELTLTPGEQQVIGAVILAGMALCAGLAIPTIFRHMLAPVILADEPAIWLWDCAARSRAMTKGRKWQLFRLILPSLLMLAAVWMGASAPTGLGLQYLPGDFAAGLICTVIPFLACVVMLIVVIRAALCLCMFYLIRTPAEASACITNEKAKETEP